MINASLRIAQIILGIVAIGLSLYVILNPSIALAYMIFILSIILIIVGLERIVHGLRTSEKTSKSSRLGNIILGIIGIGFGIFVIVYPAFTTGVLFALFAIGLIVVGAARIITGIIQREETKWLRVFQIISGTFSLIAAILVIAFPIIGIVFLAFVISLSLLVIGISSITQGITGKRIRLEKQ